MATHTRDVAWRSLQALFQELPPDAIVNIIKIDQRPGKGMAMNVRVEITRPAGPGDDLKTWAAPPAKPAEDGKGPAKPRKKPAPEPAKSAADPPKADEQGQTGAAGSSAGGK